ncbi:MAG: hypothetical protein WBC55_09845 [Dehalococcoidia bacterium]
MNLLRIIPGGLLVLGLFVAGACGGGAASTPTPTPTTTPTPALGNIAFATDRDGNGERTGYRI